MREPIDTGALLARAFRLPGGHRVRLRLVHRTDLPALRDLLERAGLEASDTALEGLVRYAPTERVVLCATALVDGDEVVVGAGAIPVEEGAVPDLLVADGRFGPGVAELVEAALRQRAEHAARRAA